MTAKETADYKPVFTAIRKGTYQESNAMTADKLERIEKAILSKPEYHYDINSMADMITERIKKNNTIIVNHYKKGGLC
jgi:CHASE3 domain sensor protein